jgi:DNA-binding NtrC family response regulator
MPVLPAGEHGLRHLEANEGQVMNPVAKDMVLVVEDDPAVRTALGRLLTRNGYAPVPAESLRQAVSAFLRCRKHLRLVIVDLALGTESGMSLIRHLRRRHPELPVIVFTGSGEGLEPGEVEALGVCGYLTKPAAPDVIVSAIRRAIGGPRAGLGVAAAAART